MTDDMIERVRRLVELYPKAVDGTLTYDQQQKYDKLMYGYGRVDEARALLAEREAREKAEAAKIAVKGSGSIDAASTARCRSD